MCMYTVQYTTLKREVYYTCTTLKRDIRVQYIHAQYIDVQYMRVQYIHIYYSILWAGYPPPPPHPHPPLSPSPLRPAGPAPSRGYRIYINKLQYSVLLFSTLFSNFILQFSLPIVFSNFVSNFISNFIFQFSCPILFLQILTSQYRFWSNRVCRVRI